MSNIRDNEIFVYWMTSNNVSDEMKNHMMTMSDEEITEAFQDRPLKFGTAGYRAIYGPGTMFLNEHTYQQLAVAYAKFLIEKRKEQVAENSNLAKLPIKIFIGHDNRRDGKKISELVANVISSFGIEVFLVQNNWMIATPIVSFIVRELCLDGAINITASHNPKNYNGFKAYNHTGAQVNEEEAEIITNFLPTWKNNLDRRYQANNRNIKYLDRKIFEKYYDAITNDIDITDYQNYYDPIVITTHHGAGSIYVPDYLESLGHNIILVDEQCYEDCEFSNSPIMNPEEKESFALAIKTADMNKSSLIIGFDPDADRMAVAVKHKGQWRFLNGNEMGIITSYYLIKNKKYGNKVPVIISTYVSNTLVNRIAEEYNGLVIRTGTGFKNIAQAMDMIDESMSEYLIGFEEAVGMNVSLSTREKDAISAAALVIEMYNFYKQQNQNFVQILENRIYQIFGKWYGETVSIKIPGIDWKQKAKDMEHAALTIKTGTKIGVFEVKDVFWNSDGNCIEWLLDGDAWIKFRISGTEPKFKIYFNLFFQSSSLKYDYERYQELVKEMTKKIKERLM